MLTGRLAPRAGLTRIAVSVGHDILDRLNRFRQSGALAARGEILIADVARGWLVKPQWSANGIWATMPVRCRRSFAFKRFFGTYYSNDMNPFTLVRSTGGCGRTNKPCRAG